MSAPTAPLTEFEVRRLDYSSNPWRIVHVPTGSEVRWEAEVVHVHGADTVLDVCGYRTRTLASEALLRMAQAAIDELRARPCQGNAPQAFHLLTHAAERLRPFAEEVRAGLGGNPRLADAVRGVLAALDGKADG